MIGPIEKKAFYWLMFRLSDDDDADRFLGRVIIMNGEFWLMLRSEDLARLAHVPPQLKLDETRLQERFRDDLGGLYFFHQGPLRWRGSQEI